MKTTVPKTSNWRELLAQREGPKHFVIEGQIAVQRLLDSDYEVEHVFKIGENLSREEASSLLGYQFHRGYLAIARKPQAVELSEFFPNQHPQRMRPPVDRPRPPPMKMTTVALS